jgi:hypothetical protein
MVQEIHLQHAQESQSGKIISGTCVHVETDGPVCETSYVCQQKPQIRCADPNFPNPGIDEKCYPGR